MNKFKTWLDENPGMATQLMKKLSVDPYHVNATCVSNIKLGRRLLPIRWMPIIVKLSKGHFKISELVEMRLQNAKR